jgi:hypothetical protein
MTGIHSSLGIILNIVDDIHINLSSGHGNEKHTYRIMDRITLEEQAESMVRLIGNEQVLVLRKNDSIWVLNRHFVNADGEGIDIRRRITISINMEDLTCKISKENAPMPLNEYEDDFKRSGMSLMENITRIFTELELTEEDMSPGKKKGGGGCCIS